MDSLEVNKVVAAGLVAGIAFMVFGLVGETLVHQPRPKETAIKIEIAQAPPAGGGGPAASVVPIATLLASADPAAGDAYAKKVCAACHSFNDGGKAGVGPNLYGVLGAPHGHMEGFNYSAALKAKQGPWTYDELNEWLLKPAAYAPGTRMSFAGITSDKQRADVIAYLRSLSAKPEPLPAPPPATAAVATAGGAAPDAGPSFDALLAKADPAKGQADTLKVGCIACHSFTDGGKAGIGPNLYNVVGAPHGHMEGFAYSAALKAKEGPWTFAELNTWLTKPAAYAPGTKMTFAGVPDPQTRADIIAYLRSLSANPVPLPPGG